MPFDAKARREFHERLHSNWPELCTWLGIEGREQERFPRGEEAEQIWRWLEVRKKLDILPEALAAIDRQDLADDLAAGRLPEAPTGSGTLPQTPPGGPRLSGQPLVERYATAAELEKQGRYPDALRELEKATARVLCDRILLLLHLGRRAEAAGLLDTVDDLHRSARLLADDPERLTARHYRAGLLWEAGLLDQAESAYREVLRGRTEELGPTDPETLRTRCSLAGVLAQQEKRWREAEEEFRAVLVERIAVLGENHPDTALTRTALADLLALQDRKLEAQTEYRLALQICQQFLGPEHPNTLAIRYRLAVLRSPERGRSATAADLSAIRDALARVLGAEHPATRAVADTLDGL